VGNFYLSVVRPAVFYRFRGSNARCRDVSGIPIVGTLLVVMGTVSGFGGVVSAVVGISVMLLDTGGSCWFLLATWKDASFWDT
jgi:hypothetical protein